MKRFLLRCLIMVVLCLAILFGLSRLYLTFVGTDYLRYRDETLKFKSVPYEIEYAGFGSSHSGASFRPEVIAGHTAFSFFLSAQSPIMDSELYTLYRDHLADNAVVTLTISPMSFYSNPTNDMTQIKRYCNALPLSALPTLKTKLYRAFRVVDFRVNDIFEYSRTRETTDFAAAEASDIEAGLIADNDKSALNWTDWGAELAAFHKASFVQNPSNGPEAHVEKAMDAMLADCVKRGYRVVLYTPPFTDYFWGNFSEEFQAQMRKDAAEFAEKYGIPYFDYSEDARFCDNTNYFEDVDHMSLEGSKAFVPVLLADIDSFYK